MKPLKFEQKFCFTTIDRNFYHEKMRWDTSSRETRGQIITLYPFDSSLARYICGVYLSIAVFILCYISALLNIFGDPSSEAKIDFIRLRSSHEIDALNGNITEYRFPEIAPPPRNLDWCFACRYNWEL